MKKIVIISSSPRRGGNSDLLCDQFMRGAVEAGNQVRKIFLRDRKINFCTGCGSCADGTKPCVQHDDAAEILAEMVAADVIVLATPVYFYSMSAQLKTLIDRSCPRYRELSNKEFYFIVTAWDPDRTHLTRTIEALRGFTEGCLENPREMAIIYGVDAGAAGEIKSRPAYLEAYQLGKCIG